MTEKFLQYIWKQQLFDNKDLITSAREKLEIIHPGYINTDAGPDFFNAKIKINETVWAGNVEVHQKSSDWYLHKHNENKSYDNVILQVVEKHDKKIYRSNKQEIPTLELKFKDDILQNYNSLVRSDTWINCANNVSKIDNFRLIHWFDRVLLERLEYKTQYIKEILIQNSNNWEETFYQVIARSFGFKTNSLPFELLAKSIPLKILAKHKNSLSQIEAVLYGQAGFLEQNTASGDYYLSLQKEYNFLKHKYNLIPIEKHLWKFLRLRPANFPTIRISQFAQLIYNSNALFSKIIETKDINKLSEYFDLKATDYWNEHYIFGKKSKKKSKKFGKTAINLILINTLVPIIFLYGKSTGNIELQERSVNFLSDIKKENNAIIKKWEELKVDVNNAATSQALIHLKNNYCDKNKCTDCQIGNILIQSKI